MTADATGILGLPQSCQHLHALPSRQLLDACLHPQHPFSVSFASYTITCIDVDNTSRQLPGLIPECPIGILGLVQSCPHLHALPLLSYC